VKRWPRWTAALSLAAPCMMTIGAPLSPAIFPSGPTVPENLLRVELRLVQPLRSPPSMDKVRLIDQLGREIDDAFLDLPLLSADGKRVTLLLHPGRVKSGVGPNLRWGRALKVGSVVTLSIDDFASAVHLRRTWQVTSRETTVPKPSDWTLDLPPAGSRAALTVHLKKPVSSTAESLIAVRGPDGARIDGAPLLADGETTWRFVPTSPWNPGQFALMTNPDMEDLAGNRAWAPFEVSPSSRADCDKGTVTPFEIRRRLSSEKRFGN